MDGVLKEVGKLDELAGYAPVAGASSKSKTPALADSLDALLVTLRAARGALTADPAGAAPRLAALPAAVAAARQDVDARQKEVYNAVARVGKALDRAFPHPPPLADRAGALFAGADERAALERAVAAHYLRAGDADVARTLAEVRCAPPMHSGRAADTARRRPASTSRATTRSSPSCTPSSPHCAQAIMRPHSRAPLPALDCAPAYPRATAGPPRTKPF
jgi:hypothetical protein